MIGQVLFDKTTKLVDTCLRDDAKNVIVHQGGSSCFHRDTFVVTDKGSIPISQVKKGMLIKSYNEQAKQEEYRECTDTMCFNNNKPTVKINLKNGRSIIATEDHKVYFKGGWVSLKHFLSLVEH